MSMAPLLAAAQNTSMFDPVSPPAESIRNLAVLVLAVTGFIFVIVEGVLVYCLLRFRRGRAAGTAEPPQVYGSQPIEIAWTAAPLLIVFVLVLVTTRTLWEVDVDAAEPRPGDDALFVTVVGRQWWWEYHYDHYNGQKLGFTTANELHMPARDEPTARPRLPDPEVGRRLSQLLGAAAGGKDRPDPGSHEPHVAPDRPDRPVRRPVRRVSAAPSTPTCSSAWSSMRPTSSSAGWTNEGAAGGRRPAKAERRQTVFLGQSCVNCHRVRGTPARGDAMPRT